MAAFRTEFNTRLHKSTIGIKSSLLTIGSCFSDGIGNKLAGNKFNTLVNPFGTTYNPLSIHKLIQMAIHNQAPSPETYSQNEDIYSNYDFHSSFSELTKEKLEKRITEAIGMVHYFLSKSEFLFLTYGTAFVYERKDTGEMVANCHKQPASLFSKQLINQETIITSFNEMYSNLKKFNPGIKIILTLSPVRHIKDTIELNSVSKSILRVACHSLTQNKEEVSYFPAYEIMMDDLRDYRFYTSDFLHPSQEAEEYIWEKFTDNYFDKDTKEIVQQWQTLKKQLEHKPFHPASIGHQKFLKETLTKLEMLNTKLNVEEEIHNLKMFIVKS
jgi:hypothetical protein